MLGPCIRHQEKGRGGAYQADVHTLEAVGVGLLAGVEDADEGEHTRHISAQGAHAHVPGAVELEVLLRLVHS